MFLPNEEREDLKQPVSRNSSILLGEPVAIKITLESIKADTERLIVQKIMLFSDSQSAVGILTFGWINTSHRSVIPEIKQTMDIMKTQNIKIELNWTPDHAEIAGNGIADKLTKEAAEEAENMPEVGTPLTSVDIKKAVKDLQEKIAKRWDVSQTGRHKFDFQPSVTAKKKTGGSIITQKIKSQLRKGYCYLNGYLHSVGLKDSPFYTCGEPESVKHYTEDCEQYEEIREC